MRSLLYMLAIAILVASCATTLPAPEVVPECSGDPVELRDFTFENGWNVTAYDLDCDGKCNLVILFRPWIDANGMPQYSVAAKMPCEKYDDYVREIKARLKRFRHKSKNNAGELHGACLGKMT